MVMRKKLKGFFFRYNMYVPGRKYKKRTGRKPSRKTTRKPIQRRRTNRRVYKKRRLPFLVKNVKPHSQITAVTRSICPAHPLTKRNAIKYRAYPVCRSFLNAGTSASSGTGSQGVLDVTFMSIGQLQTFYNQLNPQGLSLNPITGQYANLGQFYLDKYFAEIDFTNSSNTLMELDMYEWMCKDDVSYPPKVLWGDSLSDENGNASTTLQNIAGISMVDGIEGIGVFWKLKKIHKFILQPGQGHKHIHSVNLRRVINPYMFGGSNVQTDTYLRHISTCFTFVFHGGVASIPASGTSTYSVSQLDLVQTVRFEGKFGQYNIPKLFQQPGLATAGVLSSYNFGSGSANVPATI